MDFIALDRKYVVRIGNVCRFIHLDSWYSFAIAGYTLDKSNDTILERKRENKQNFY